MPLTLVGYNIMPGMSIPVAHASIMMYMPVMRKDRFLSTSNRDDLRTVRMPTLGSGAD